MSTRGFIGYKYKGVIKGFYNHFDSYPSGIGTNIINHIYCKYPWEVIKDFFLNRLTLTNKDATDERHISTLNLHCDSSVKKDDSDFLKDGLFCEYSYVFDLDSKKKKLMLFAGFGKKPSKGYEDLFYDSRSGELSYNNYKGAVSGELNPIIAMSKMFIVYREEDGEDNPPLWKVLRDIIKSPTENLPTYIGYSDRMCVKELLAYRLS